MLFWSQLPFKSDFETLPGYHSISKTGAIVRISGKPLEVLKIKETRYQKPQCVSGAINEFPSVANKLLLFCAVIYYNIQYYFIILQNVILLSYIILYYIILHYVIIPKRVMIFDITEMMVIFDQIALCAIFCSS